MTLLAIALLLTTWFSARTLNPLAVYARGGMGARIAISIMAILIITAGVQLLSQQFMRAMIARTANMPADDIMCPGCGRALIAFVSSHGVPVRCVQCGKWWHSGPICFNRDSPGNQRMIRPCPSCVVAAASMDDDLMDEPVDSWPRPSPVNRQS